MLLRFTKMHGLGNDFVVLDLITQRFNLQTRHVRKIADRHFGIGCDQVLIVEAPRDPDVDFRYRIFNADGSEVEQCGNGARCFARFVRDKKLCGKNVIRVETNSGIIELSVLENSQIEVNMGAPELREEEIPFSVNTDLDERGLIDFAGTAQAVDATNVHTIVVDGRALNVGVTSMGNPHATLIVDDVQNSNLEQLGPAIETHEQFPQRVNVGFMQVVNRGLIKLRVFERGVGETLACGTGACAAVVSGILRGLLDSNVQVQLPGGSLTIEWQGENHPVLMTGPTANVFEGQVLL